MSLVRVLLSIFAVVAISPSGVIADPDAVRMKGATEIDLEDVPYLAAIVVEESDGIHCVASKIGPNVLVTAAHCLTVSKNEPMAVSDVYVYMDIGNGWFSKISVVGIEIHSNYLNVKNGSDIALMFLASHYDTPDIGIFKGDVDSPTGTLYSWGPTDPDSAVPINPVKRHVGIPSNEECHKAFKEALGVSILSSMICAGPDENENISESGDSGGPLTVRGDDGKEYLVGVGSYVRNKSLNYPYYTVLTLVSYYAEWIKETIATESEHSTAAEYFTAAEANSNFGGCFSNILGL